jgi:hypothetical protein
MTNPQLLKRLQDLETAERDVASSVDMSAEDTANWQYAETAASARSALLQQQDDIQSLTTQRDHWLQIAREKDLEIERLHIAIRNVLGAARNNAWAADECTVKRELLGALRESTAPSLHTPEPGDAPPDLWTCDECAGPPRPYEEVQCVLGKCKPVRTE